MKRAARPFLAGTILVLTALTLSAASSAPAGGPPTALSFFSGGLGARANWVTLSDRPPRATDHQAIRLLTINRDASHADGYAGILVQHVAGIPADRFPDSSFWIKVPKKPGSTLASPRLVVEFRTERGRFVGYGSLRERFRGTGWEAVDDRTNYPKAAWDVSGGPCGFLYSVRWTTVQQCFIRDKVLSVFIVADSYGIDHLIDGIQVNGTTFSDAADNSGGDNRRAGPKATTDRSLLPKLVFPP